MLRVNKQVLLDAKDLSNDGDFKDEKGNLCIKCLFISATPELQRPWLDISWSEKYRLYFRVSLGFDLMAANNITISRELNNLCDRYENKLFTLIENSNTVKDRKALIKDFIAELEEQELVQFVEKKVKVTV